MASRGFENNNPGNLVITSASWKGKVPLHLNTDGHFEQFTQMYWGLRAMMIDIVGDIVKDGKNTLRKLIHEYAPAFENNTSAYINYVSNKTGLKPDEAIKLDKSLLAKIIRAKIEVENGKDPSDKYYTDKDFNKAFSELPLTTLSQINANQTFPLLIIIAAITLIWLITFRLIKK